MELTVLIHLGINAKTEEITATQSAGQVSSQNVTVACTYTEDCEVLRLIFERSKNFKIVDNFTPNSNVLYQVNFNQTVLNHITPEHQKLVYVISDPRQYVVDPILSNQNQTSISKYCDELRTNIDFLYDNDLWTYGQNLKVIRIEDLQLEFDSLLSFMDYQGTDLKFEQASRQSWRELDFETIHKVWLSSDSKTELL